MNKIGINKQIDYEMSELIVSFARLKSIIEIFSEAVDYDTSLENKYNDMVKVIEMLVLDVEPCISGLSEQLNLLPTEEEL